MHFSATDTSRVFQNPSYCRLTYFPIFWWAERVDGWSPLVRLPKKISNLLFFRNGTSTAADHLFVMAWGLKVVADDSEASGSIFGSAWKALVTVLEGVDDHLFRFGKLFVEWHFGVLFRCWGSMEFWNSSKLELFTCFFILISAVGVKGADSFLSVLTIVNRAYNYNI